MGRLLKALWRLEGMPGPAAPGTLSGEEPPPEPRIAAQSPCHGEALQSLQSAEALLDEVDCSGLATEAVEDSDRSPKQVDSDFGSTGPKTPAQSKELAGAIGEPDPAWGALAGLLLDEFPAERPAVLMWTTPGGPGATRCTAAWLAAALAERAPGQVLAVDCDFQRPGLAAVLGCQRPSDPNGRWGLAEVLAAGASWREAVCPTRRRGLDVLPAAAAPATGPLLVPGGAWRALLAELRQRYRLVLLEVPGLEEPGAACLARGCDAALLVLRPGRTGRRAARRAVRLLKQSGVKALGCVLLGV